MIRLAIIERPNAEEFIQAFEDFVARHQVTKDIKFQRNLFYAGIGSSAGRTPGSTQDINQSKLDESYVAFIPWIDVTDMEDTRGID
jgi:hypothetical protein